MNHHVASGGPRWTPRRRALVLLGALVAAVGAAAAGSIALAGPTGPARTPLRSHGRQSAAVETPSTGAQDGLFAALRSGAPASVALVAAAQNLVDVDAQAPVPVAPQLNGLRTAYEDADVTTGLLPSARGVCFVGVVNGTRFGACTSTSGAATQGLFVTEPLSAGITDVVGVLPDGASGASFLTTAGTSVRVQLNALNAFSESLYSAPTSFSFTDASGTTRTTALELPAARTTAG